MARKGNPILVRICAVVLLLAVFMVCNFLFGGDFLVKLQDLLLVRSLRFLFFRLIGWGGPLILFLLITGLLSAAAGEESYQMMAPSGGGEGGSGAGPSGEGTSGTKLPVTANKYEQGLIPQTGEKWDSGSPMEPPIFEGIPVPIDKEEEALSSPFYNASVVHIPGEVEDPLTLSRFSKLNALLLFLKENVFHEIRGDYTRRLQQELNQTPAAALPAKLEEIRLRELAWFGLQDW